jgi:hypothetical protein
MAMNRLISAYFVSIFTITLFVAACSPGGNTTPPTTVYTLPQNTISLPSNTSNLSPITFTLSSDYTNPARLGTGLSGKIEAGFTATTSTIERDGTINVTYHLAILNKTRQTINGYVVRIVVMSQDGKILFASRETVPHSNERISILPGILGEDAVWSVKFDVSSEVGGNDDKVSKMTTEMYIESINWEDGKMIS